MGDAKVASLSAPQHSASAAAPTAITSPPSPSLSSDSPATKAPHEKDDSAKAPSPTTPQTPPAPAVSEKEHSGNSSPQRRSAEASTIGDQATSIEEQEPSPALNEVTQSKSNDEAPTTAPAAQVADSTGDPDLAIESERTEEKPIVADATGPASEGARTDPQTELNEATSKEKADEKATRDTTSPANASIAHTDHRIVEILDDDDDEEDHEIAEITSIEDSSPEVICLDHDDQPGTPQDEDGDAFEATATATSDADSKAAPQQPRRKRKRTRVFTSIRHRNQKRHSLSVLADAGGDAAGGAPLSIPSASRVRRQQSADASSESSVIVVDTAATPSGDVVTWDWESCRPYLDPLTQGDMNELRRIRRECASIVAANTAVWPRTRRLDHDDTHLVAMLNDAMDENDHLRVRPVRRGRYYRDMWEEEDFLASHLKPSRSGKKRPFAGCEMVRSGRELVRGYDDALFQDFIARLQQQASAPPAAHPTTSTASPEKTPTRRLKVAKRRTVDSATLPEIPARETHPASCGSWKLRGSAVSSYDAIHPAAIRDATLTQRWSEEWGRDVKNNQPIVVTAPRRSGRREANQDENRDDDTNDKVEDAQVSAHCDDRISDDAAMLPSFGIAIEEDEISREIDNSLTRLVEVSALNWRRTQTVYERAVTHIELQPLHQADQDGQQRLKTLYRKIFPPVDDDEDEDESVRAYKLQSRPRDLVAYATRLCRDANEVEAVGASVEFAVRLRVGEQVDVLDRNICWNDGVVIELSMDADRSLTYVLVSYAMWGDDACEWVSIVDGRLLPRGVADGRAEFTMVVGPAGDRLVTLNKEMADLLLHTFPHRHISHLTGRAKPLPNPGGDMVATLVKKPRRR